MLFRSNGHETHSSAASIKSDTSKGKGKDTTSDAPVGKDPQSTSSTDNLVGKLNNLITTDLQNIVDGRDFPMLSKKQVLSLCTSLC